VSHSPDAPPPVARRLHRAARFEDAVGGVVGRVLRRRGWRPRVLTFTGYGADGWVRVLARVLLTPPGTRTRDIDGRRRGWRQFFSAGVAGLTVTIELGDRRHEVVSARGGYLDVRLDAQLPSGWATARLSTDGSRPSEAALRIIDPAARLGLVSDIDDTVVVTALPRPLLAFWNTFVRREHSRVPVPGMAQLYKELLAQDLHAPIFYLSTGAWNTAPALTRFLDRHGYPPGPLLMTDWGPTPDRWFRSGQAHKRAELRRLMDEFPALTWILVGDDGQHDPDLYTAAAEGAPGRIRVLAIRQLTAAQQVRTHGTPEPLPERLPTAAAPEVRAPDGFGLLELLRTRGLLSGSRQS
jgi:phosphatidate phosphatase APP1